MNSSDYFENNRTTAALTRDAETEIVSHGPRPVNLRTIPRERWDEYLSFHLTVPPAVLTTLDGEPIPPGQLDAYEDAVAHWHGITAPYYVSTSFALRSLGRPWRYVPEAAEFLTGFTLCKDAA